MDKLEEISLTRLAKLKEQAALKGISCEPHILVEIEKLEAQLRVTNSSVGLNNTRKLNTVDKEHKSLIIRKKELITKMKSLEKATIYDDNDHLENQKRVKIVQEDIDDLDKEIIELDNIKKLLERFCRYDTNSTDFAEMISFIEDVTEKYFVFFEENSEIREIIRVSVPYYCDRAAKLNLEGSILSRFYLCRSKISLSDSLKEALYFCTLSIESNGDFIEAYDLIIRIYQDMALESAKKDNLKHAKKWIEKRRNTRKRLKMEEKNNNATN